VFDNLILIGDKDNKENKETWFTINYSCGLKTQRDTWCYNSSEEELAENIKTSIDFYNEQRELLAAKKVSQVKYDSTKFSWTAAALNDVNKNYVYSFNDGELRSSLYRPFFKQKVFFYRQLNERMYQIPKLFPTSETENLVICVSGVGVTKDFSCTITNIIPDLELIGKSQCFPLYYYEENADTAKSLFDDDTNDKYIRRDGITDWILKEVRSRFPGSGRALTKEHIFYYVYGILYSKQYRERFASDLKKSLPRIPIADDVNTFMDFSNAGKKLAALHLNYEDVPAYDGVTVEAIKPATYQEKSESNILNYGELIAASPSWESDTSFDEYEYYRVEKMRFPSKDQKDTIIYNHYITIKNIPAKAYEYIVNGKSAIEWIMERYAVTVDKDSLIKNDPNDWSREHNKPRYILDLLLSVINVSVQTVDVVNGLPAVKVE
jgi:predicted helicase